MFTCSHCTFRHPFEWSLKEHMYVKHNDSSNLNINSTILSPPTKIYAGQNGVNVPTTISIPPIRRVGRQSGMGVEYEDTESEHGDTDEETVSPPTKIYVGKNGRNVPTTISIPPIRRVGRQS